MREASGWPKVTKRPGGDNKIYLRFSNKQSTFPEGLQESVNHESQALGLREEWGVRANALTFQESDGERKEMVRDLGAACNLGWNITSY